MIFYKKNCTLDKIFIKIGKNREEKGYSNSYLFFSEQGIILSIQASRFNDCYPREDIKDLNEYKQFEVAIIDATSQKLKKIRKEFERNKLEYAFWNLDDLHRIKGNKSNYRLSEYFSFMEKEDVKKVIKILCEMRF